MEGEKKERPQNRNLKPLGSGMLTPEEELAIRRKSAYTTHEKRRRNADIRAAVRAVANLNLNGKAKSKDIEKLISVDQLDEPGAPMISRVVYSQFQLAMAGDKESRDWICRMLGVNPAPEEVAPGLTVTAETDAVENVGGVRIHLIRGEKPKEAESEEDAATRAANRLAVVEAMKAAGEAAEQIGEAVAGKVAEALADADSDSDG